MNAEQFLQLANRLALSSASGPAEYRTAISRAYYAIFHAARALLNDQMQFYCKAGVNEHQWVQRHFLNCSLPSAVKIGNTIRNMHDARKEADYNLASATIETGLEAKVSLERAADVNKLLDRNGHPAEGPSLRKYTEHLKKDRWLRQQGWDVHRFSTLEVENEQAPALLHEIGIGGPF